MLRRLNDLAHVVFHDVRWKTTQTVVSAEFQNDEIRMEVFQGCTDTGFTPFSCFAADAGVNDTMFVPL